MQQQEDQGEGEVEEQADELPDLGEDPPNVDLDISSDLDDKQLPPSLDTLQIRD